MAEAGLAELLNGGEDLGIFFPLGAKLKILHSSPNNKVPNSASLTTNFQTSSARIHGSFTFGTFGRTSHFLYGIYNMNKKV
jgi:hypothetical protein